MGVVSKVRNGGTKTAQGAKLFKQLVAYTERERYNPKASRTLPALLNVNCVFTGRFVDVSERARRLGTPNVIDPMPLAAIPGTLVETLDGGYVAIRLSSSPATIILYKSGEFLATGCASFHQGLSAIWDATVLIQTTNQYVVPVAVDVQNMVFSGTFDRKITMKKLARFAGTSATYESKKFPGLRFVIDDGATTNRPIVAIVFPSGSVIIVGCPDEETAMKHFRALANIIACIEHDPDVNSMLALKAQAEQDEANATMDLLNDIDAADEPELALEYNIHDYGDDGEDEEEIDAGQAMDIEDDVDALATYDVEDDDLEFEDD